MLSTYKNAIIKSDLNKIFDVIMSIEQYPEFLPWCSNAKILNQNSNITIANLSIGAKGINHTYKSQILVDKHESKYIIKINSQKSGPLDYLEATWKLEYLDQENSQVDFAVHFKLSSKILELLISNAFENIVQKIMTAFQNRMLYIQKN
jgi:coenzyme Q-binding protein COQ10